MHRDLLFKGHIRVKDWFKNYFWIGLGTLFWKLTAIEKNMKAIRGLFTWPNQGDWMNMTKLIWLNEYCKVAWSTYNWEMQQSGSLN